MNRIMDLQYKFHYTLLVKLIISNLMKIGRSLITNTSKNRLSWYCAKWWKGLYYDMIDNILKCCKHCNVYMMILTRLLLQMMLKRQRLFAGTDTGWTNTGVSTTPTSKRATTGSASKVVGPWWVGKLLLCIGKQGSFNCDDGGKDDHFEWLE